MRLTNKYIFDFDGIIATILGLDIKYNVKSKKVSLFIWRSRLVSNPEKKEVILLKIFSV